MQALGYLMIGGSVLGGVVSASMSVPKYNDALETLDKLNTQTTTLQGTFQKLQDANGQLSAEILTETINAANNIQKYKDEINAVSHSFGEVEFQTITIGIIVNLVVILIFLAKVMIIPKLNVKL